ncbi:SRPBCC domain-containing protein [Sphingomonas soli]|uniref:SRPBCC domain-containing protein n=1 Tax=Sphingomonas soli TaxID=266127 RepID=UPI000834B6FE|nr:SRPBCC domain-containing protein [Sphingomonas soli]
MDEFDRQMWRVVIAAPIETVWNILVQTDEVLPFLFGATCQTEDGLHVGKPMRMVSKDGKHVIAYGEVLEFSPPHRFSHAINFAMVSDEPPARTTYELVEVAGGTELTLTSQALAGTKTAKMSKSGQYIVDNLKAVVETGRPTFGGRMMLRMSPIMSLMTPRRCRVADWPLSRVPLAGGGTMA